MPGELIIFKVFSRVYLKNTNVKANNKILTNILLT